MNTIDVMHAVIQRYDVRAALGKLEASGCRVRIVVTRELIENWLEARVTLRGGAKIDIPDRDVKTLVTHDKVYAIHARWRGREAYLVVTGTSNATCGGLLYNDEMMVRLQGKWAWEQYRGHVSRAFRHAHQGRIRAMPVQAHCR
jgi:phosphatidylserine/phosphatidylglycerophosphate/cardiolipin synthase-like enzyme